MNRRPHEDRAPHIYSPSGAIEFFYLCIKILRTKRIFASTRSRSGANVREAAIPIMTTGKIEAARHNYVAALVSLIWLPD